MGHKTTHAIPAIKTPSVSGIMAAALSGPVSADTRPHTNSHSTLMSKVVWNLHAAGITNGGKMRPVARSAAPPATFAVAAAATAYPCGRKTPMDVSAH